MNIDSKVKYFPFTDLPGELQVNLISLRPIAEIFNWLSVNNELYTTSRQALVIKARVLGWTPNKSQDKDASNFGDAMRYIQTIFFTCLRQTHVKKGITGSFKETYKQKYKKAAENERMILNMPRSTTEEKHLFFHRLQGPFRELPGIIFKIPKKKPYWIIPTKEHFVSFVKHFLNIEVPDTVQMAFTFTMNSLHYPKLSVLGMLAAIIDNDEELFFNFFEDGYKIADVVEYQTTKHHYDILKDDEGNNLFHWITFLGRKDLLTRMLGLPNTALINKCLSTKNKSGSKPIDYAAIQGHKGVVDQLLNYNSSIQPDFSSSFRYACKTGDFQYFYAYCDRREDLFFEEHSSLLAKRYMQLKERFKDEEIVPPGLLRRKIVLIEAVKRGHQQAVRDWAKNEFLINFSQDKKSLLEYALEANQYHVIPHLIFAGHPVTDVQINEKLVQVMDEETFRYLMRAGAVLDPEAIPSRLRDYYETFMKVCSHINQQDLKAMQFLFEETNTKTAIMDALIMSALEGNAFVLKILDKGFLNISPLSSSLMVLQIFKSMKSTNFKMDNLSKKWRELVQNWIPKEKSLSNSSDKPLIFYVVDLECPKLLDLFLQKEWSLNASYKQNNLLRYAIKNNKMKAIDFLIKKGVTVDNKDLIFAIGVNQQAADKLSAALNK